MSETRPTLSVDRPLGPLRYHFLRLAVRFLVGSVVRVRVENADVLPDGGCVVCFNHPSWVDPFAFTGFWPGRRWLFILGPRERDLRVGWKNRLIGWSRRGVPLKPGGEDLLETTRRAVAVLERGDVLAVAGEGRVADREGTLLPLEGGAAYFALRARVPVVPMAILGTRWVHFGKRVTLRFGAPVATAGRPRGRAGLVEVTEEVRASLARLLADARDEEPPGRFWRWFSEVFNDRGAHAA